MVLKDLINLFKSVLALIFFSAVFTACHYYVNLYFLKSPIEIVRINFFFFLINLFLICFFFVVVKNWTDKAGFAFMSFFLVKAILMLTFLLIYRESNTLDVSFVLHFFCVYFAQLLFSLYNSLTLLKIYTKKG